MYVCSLPSGTPSPVGRHIGIGDQNLSQHSEVKKKNDNFGFKN